MINKINRIALIALAITLCTHQTEAAENNQTALTDLIARRETLRTQMSNIKSRWRAEPIVSCGPLNITRKNIIDAVAVLTFGIPATLGLCVEAAIAPARKEAGHTTMSGIWFLGILAGAAGCKAVIDCSEPTTELAPLRTELKRIREELLRHEWSNLS